MTVKALSKNTKRFLLLKKKQSVTLSWRNKKHAQCHKNHACGALKVYNIVCIKRKEICPNEAGGDAEHKTLHGHPKSYTRSSRHVGPNARKYISHGTRGTLSTVRTPGAQCTATLNPWQFLPKIRNMYGIGLIGLESSANGNYDGFRTLCKPATSVWDSLNAKTLSVHCRGLEVDSKHDKGTKVTTVTKTYQQDCYCKDSSFSNLPGTCSERS